MPGWQKHIIFYSIIAALVSVFVSRLALSLSAGLLILACCVHSDIKKQLHSFFTSPLLWSMSLLFLLPLISGGWSEDKQEWLSNMRIKIPLLLLPLAFASPFQFSGKQWRVLVLSFIMIVVVASAWSMFHYAADITAINEGYLRSTSMRTPLENDHVRFSWLVNLAILVAVWAWWDNRNEKNSYWLLVIVAWLIVFLHILAARTGLLAFYIVLLATALWLILKKARPAQSFGLIAILITMPVVAYWMLPSFQNRIKYFRYEFEYAKDAHYLPGGNDATRIISSKAGWELMTDNAIVGVGFGDISTETKEWYDTHYPQMLHTDKILPSNEWLIYGVGSGIPGFLVFTWAMLAFFTTGVKNRWRWWLLNTLVATSFLFDIGLEIQFGVFIYCLTVLLCWKWFRRAT